VKKGRCSQLSMMACAQQKILLQEKSTLHFKLSKSLFRVKLWTYTEVCFIYFSHVSYITHKL